MTNSLTGEPKTTNGTQADNFFIKHKDKFSSFSIGALNHNFHKHPLMQLDKLKTLAEFLMPREQCRFVSPDMKLDSDFQHYSKATDGSTLDDFFSHIDQPKSWLALYNVEVHPEYHAFVESIINTVRPQVEQEQGEIFTVNGFIFISAPPSVTPFHIDRENNFWLQIQGKKKMTVFDYSDRDIVSGRAVEDFIVDRNLSNVRLQKKFIDRGREFNVGPGDGVYFPSTSPHMTQTTTEWATPSDGVSISIGVVFYTKHTKAQAQVHQCNNVLRRFGFSPKAPGTNSIVDRIKRPIGKTLAIIKSRFRGYNPPPGSY